MPVKVSDIRIRLTSKDAKNEPYAWVSCVFNDCLFLNNIAIRKNKRDGHPRLVFPAKKSSSGKKYYFYHPINNDARLAIEDAVFGELEEMLDRDDEDDEDQND